MILPENPPIIVLGMHRSGTTMIAELLSDMGVFMGNELDFFFESKYFQNINKKILASGGAFWADPQPFIQTLDSDQTIKKYTLFVKDLLNKIPQNYGNPGQFKAWGWKDPRNTLTFPIWQKLFPEARVIHVIRNGLDVAMSLHRREIHRYFQGKIMNRLFPPTIGKAYRLWELYIKIGLTHAKTHQNWYSVFYENILANPESEIRNLMEFTGIKSNSLVIKRILKKIRNPKKRRLLTATRLRILLWLGIIKPNLLNEIGYELHFAKTKNT